MISLKKIIKLTLATAACFYCTTGDACTGIRLKAIDGSNIIARTMEWGSFEMPSQLFVMPRGYTKYAMMPDGTNGLKFTSKYGYIGIGVHEQNFITEAVNEKGLAVQMLYFPGYGESEVYDSSKKINSITDAEILSWIIGSFATVDEMVSKLDDVRMVGFEEGSATPHFSIMDATGHHVVLEYYEHKWHIYENTVGVITNSPRFDWQLTNLNNYVNVMAGTSKPQKISDSVTLRSFGAGSAGLGLPGDVTPPSRFVRAAYYVNNACKVQTGKDAVMQAFQILNNFDIPVGIEFGDGEREHMPNDMISATQWTSATDTKELKFYYRTVWNNTTRCIDLKKINFDKVKYQTMLLDNVREHRIEEIKFK